MSSIDALVGQRIRARRQSLKLTQTQLADSIGVTFQQVQKYENGANRVSAARLWAISEVLEVPISFFFEGANSEGADGDAAAQRRADAFSNRDAIELMDLYASLPEQQRAAVLLFLRSVADTPNGAVA